ncbi:hypothetical protein HELRODRAFT_169190 [Helobdella robusta]|uniref:Uncharacterized protein n=1 Tax=Helobdella robusta TaxID=6412 RepID=T1F1J8_HELRO|nr:hypothetical protein HELRODRAFT_169190 [Helobdella robusta]ESO08372.1 hypothetical protein HELRODRAFT_169190 [Helobdella robusta]
MWRGNQMRNVLLSEVPKWFDTFVKCGAIVTGDFKKWHLGKGVVKDMRELGLKPELAQNRKNVKDVYGNMTKLNLSLRKNLEKRGFCRKYDGYEEFCSDFALQLRIVKKSTENDVRKEMNSILTKDILCRKRFGEQVHHVPHVTLPRSSV